MKCLNDLQVNNVIRSNKSLGNIMVFESTTTYNNTLLELVSSVTWNVELFSGGLIDKTFNLLKIKSTVSKGINIDNLNMGQNSIYLNDNYMQNSLKIYSRILEDVTWKYTYSLPGGKKIYMY